MIKMIPLSQLGTLRNGMNYNKKSAIKGCKIIGVADFGNKVFPDYGSLQEIDATIVTDEDLLHNGDILFVRSNGNKNLVGRSIFIKNIQEPVCYSGFCIALRPNFEIIFPEFLFYVLRSPFCRKQYSYSQQTNITNLSQEVLGSVVIPVPDYDIQKQIAAILYDIDKKVDLNSQICFELESMAKTLYDYWFVQFDFPDENGSPYRTSGGEMVWNDHLKREIPKGWEVKHLKDILYAAGTSVTPGKSLEGLPYTPIDELPKRSMSFWGGQSSEQAQSSLQLYEEDDLLLGAMRVYFHRVCIAAQKGITRSTTLVLKPYIKSFLPYAFQILNMDGTIQYATKISVGTQQPYVNWANGLDSYLVPYPSTNSIINDYCNRIWPVVVKVKTLNHENHELTKLRDWLLPMLMNGQATVE